MICSCDFLPEEIKLCNVNFYVDGELYTTKTAIIGQTVSMPKAPQKENEIFVGWFVDGVFSYEYDFSSLVIADTNLYAMFTLDAIALTNMITTKTITAKAATMPVKQPAPQPCASLLGIPRSGWDCCLLLTDAERGCVALRYRASGSVCSMILV